MPGRVLLVDDEFLILYGLARALRRDGVEVKAVTSAEEALQAMAEESFDLCFLDVCLPGMDGIDALAHMRDRSPATRVALMTANYRDPRVARAVDEHQLDLVEKPFDLGRVRQIAAETLEEDE